MKKGLLWALVLLMLLCTPVANAAGATAIQVMGVALPTNAPNVIFELRVQDQSGAGVRAVHDTFSFEAELPDQSGTVPLKAVDLGDGHQGHIVVVDTSTYYYGFDGITAEDLQNAIKAYLNEQSGRDWVKFLLARENAVEETSFMSMQEAYAYVNQIALHKANASAIHSAIYNALQIASIPHDNGPIFSSIFMLVDPDVESNRDQVYSLEELIAMRGGMETRCDLTVATIYREKYLKGAAKARSAGVENGLTVWKNFAQRCGAGFAQGYHGNAKTLDTAEISAVVSQVSETKQIFSVDLTPLVGHVEPEPLIQTVPIKIHYRDSSTTLTATFQMHLDTSVLPLPDATPTPEPTATPIPGPTPWVHIAQEDGKAKNAVYALYELGYLEDKNHKGFDDESYYAYKDFCRVNRIEDKEKDDGIYEEGYNLLLSGNALPKPTPTPTPTPEPTPEPTLAPMVAVGQEDEKAREAVYKLYTLGYLADTNHKGFDDACYYAYIAFCEVNGIKPGGGVYEEGYNLLLSDYAQPKPTPTPEPTPNPDDLPLVAVGQDDDTAWRAIYQLNKLGYLPSTDHKGFDEKCYYAYIEFCDANQIEAGGGIFEEGYNLLLSDYAMPKATPTPSPSPTPSPTPEPTATPVPTLPPYGYQLGNGDTQDSGGFIAAMQTVLKNLNCFTAEAKVGTVDQATLDAINLYCETYGWVNDQPQGISKELCNDILTNGPQRSPRVQTLREKSLTFLMSEAFVISGYSVRMWMPVVLCVVLLFIILLLVILSRGKKSKPEPKPERESERKRNTNVKKPSGQSGNGAVQVGESSMVNRAAAQGRGEQRAQRPAEEPTKGKEFSKPVTLYIDYAGKRDMCRIEVRSGTSFIIGRRSNTTGCDLPLDASDKDASRRHAALYLDNDRVMITDLGSMNGTIVNGQVLRGKSTNAEMCCGGNMLHSNDKIQIGQHMIKVSL